MADLFFCSDLSNDVVSLVDQEAHHASRVLRLKVGNSIRLFDGRGKLAEGVIQEIGKRQVTVAISTSHQSLRSESPRVSIAAAVPKGDRLKWMVEKLTELGVDEFIPLATERSVSGCSEARLEKLRTTVITAAKQSNSLWLMNVRPLTPLSEVLVDHRSLYVAHPDMNPSCDHIRQTDCVIAIGPEGGFTDDEIAAARTNGAGFISWPNTILRIETAAVTFASLALSPR